MNEAPLKTGRPYLLKQTTQTATASVTALAYRLDVNTLEHVPAAQLAMNEIGSAAIETNRPLFFDPYATNRATGNFILIDPISNATVAAGMIESRPPVAVQKSETEVSLQFAAEAVTPAERRARAGHLPAIVWVQGRPALARLLEAKLFAIGCQVFALGENTPPDATLHAARALAAAGLIAIAAADAGGAAASPSEYFESSPKDLPGSNEDAARRILSELSAAGIVSTPGDLLGGEGI